MNEHEEPDGSHSELTNEVPVTDDTGAAGSPNAKNLCQQIYTELRKVFFGQDHVVSQVIAAFLAGGHVLLEGKPGLGKTHLV
ncbi:MAG: AAA family ATPase, partial [Verrucomicrobiae bacterium]|nr:AAA family ATPase [Verrucomicrobiae bacterium]NNJ87149.1 AAA family ATPase [Akkermansiaceae bacterium]